MYKVLNVFLIGALVTLTLEGAGENIYNGCTLVDEEGNKIKVISVGMTRYENPEDIKKYTDILTEKCSVKKGCKLYLA